MHSQEIILNKQRLIKNYTLRTILPAVVILILTLPVNILSNDESLVKTLNERSIPLTDEESIDTLIAEAAEHRLVLLGESTHGTSEYYQWRYKISKILIEEHGFDFIAVEGDWPSFYVISQQVKAGTEDRPDFEKLFAKNFNRWPQWMWANQETITLAEWLTSYNENKLHEQRVGIYGMDVYSKEESIEQVREYLKDFDAPEYHTKAALYDCFSEYDYDGQNYARAIHFGAAGCADNVLRVVNFLRDNKEYLKNLDSRKYFNAKQNALIVKNAEKHYRSATRRDESSWNYRASHFYLTVERLLDYYGDDAKGVVWAHNTHIGDARATTMVRENRKNIGQLAREDLGPENVFLVGFGCFKGRVIAGSRWGSRKQIMRMPEAGHDSIEIILNNVDHDDYYFLMDEELKQYRKLREHVGHRAVGVVYNPSVEYPGNYVPTILSERYNAFIFFQQTTPLSPIDN